MGLWLSGKFRTIHPPAQLFLSHNRGSVVLIHAETISYFSFQLLSGIISSRPIGRLKVCETQSG